MPQTPTAPVSPRSREKGSSISNRAERRRRWRFIFPAIGSLQRTRRRGVILFHGGGWSGGNLEQFRHACKYLASRGLVAATANYRMLRKDEPGKLPPGESKKRVCIT